MTTLRQRIGIHRLWVIIGSVLLIASASAWGADSNLIHACVNNHSGTIHIIAATGSCHPNETLLTWSAQGITGYQIVTHQVFLTAGQSANVHVDCPSGKKVLGGGFDVETPEFVKIFSSEPSDGAGNITDHGWNLFVQNQDTRSRQATVSAICAFASN